MTTVAKNNMSINLDIQLFAGEDAISVKEFVLKRKPVTLSDFKNVAFIMATHRRLFSEFAAKTELVNTKFQGGKYMEIVMAWMLGYFRSISHVYMNVEISEYLDKNFHIDFNFQRGSVGVDMKFDKDEKDDTHVPSEYVKIARTYPSRPGNSSSKTVMTGVEALRTVLEAVYPPYVIDGTLNSPEFSGIINALWADRSTKV